MKIFKIWQDVNNGYDVYDSAIVAANNKKEAKLIRPNEYGWCDPEDVQVEYIGMAKKNTKSGCILASYNAG